RSPRDRHERFVRVRLNQIEHLVLDEADLMLDIDEGPLILQGGPMLRFLFVTLKLTVYHPNRELSVRFAARSTGSPRAECVRCDGLRQSIADADCCLGSARICR